MHWRQPREDDLGHRESDSENWIALVMPDARPERIGLMTYVTNVVFLHDGKVYTVDFIDSN